MIDQEFDARGIAVACVETRGMEDRGAGILLSEAKEGRERESIVATELLEFGENEASVSIELHRLTFDTRNKLQVFRRTTTFKLGRLAAGGRVIDAGLRERLEREVGERSRHLDGRLRRGGVGGHQALFRCTNGGAELGFLTARFF